MTQYSKETGPVPPQFKRAGEFLEIRARNDEKQWVAEITGSHPEYNLEREFILYQKRHPDELASRRFKPDEGTVIERVVMAYDESKAQDDREARFRDYFVYRTGSRKLFKTDEEAVLDHFENGTKIDAGRTDWGVDPQ